MVDCLLGLGSNVGDRTAQLDAAVQLICGHPQIRCVGTSRYHATRPVGGPSGQDAFLNAALRIRTTLAVDELFVVLQDVEQRLGRRRLERWGPRTIDIDILLYGLETVDDARPRCASSAYGRTAIRVGTGSRSGCRHAAPWDGGIHRRIARPLGTTAALCRDHRVLDRTDQQFSGDGGYHLRPACTAR